MRTFILLLIAIPFMGFAVYNSIDPNSRDADINKTKYAHAEIFSNGTSGVSGKLEFHKVAGGVHISGTISGLTPGLHGMHIHEKGVCDGPGFESAGGHFNPDMSKHGGPDSARRHAGDYGNILANDYGTAYIDYIDRESSLRGKYSILGRSIVVHEKADDMMTDPSGNSGSRLGCGVIIPGRK
ncbi:superoxide dismutase family protein [soil metagenome]